MPLDLRNGVVELAHGSGGRAMSVLLEELILPGLGISGEVPRNDAAILPAHTGRPVVATDSHVISPLFFPGGNIGSLSVHGTINDLAMMGAMPHALTLGLILEEGFPLADLSRVLAGIRSALDESRVAVVTGDTKVVERGQADGIYINTTGLGYVQDGLDLSPGQIQAGDKLLVSGTLGDHGMCILSQRQEIPFESELQSDSQALDGLVRALLTKPEGLRCLRDPTRGGLGATLNEIAQTCGFGIHLIESSIPVRQDVRASCEMLGLDPLYLANEGKLVAFCAPEQADEMLNQLRSHPAGREAAIIGHVISDTRKLVELETSFGSDRLIDWRYSDPLPRIC